ncbi:uncharacterized protein METZ01_LOCUS70305 [marine metagenome]|uniref:Uncharacterized protein n=1 Tax=marine metagenome TaxID=408172 RepID=A0A381TPP0_9ZZZZ
MFFILVVILSQESSEIDTGQILVYHIKI